MLPNRFRISHTESGMGLTQIYEPLIIHENISVRRLASPIDSIDCIRTLITIVHSLFIAHHFFSCIDKRNTLRSEDYRLRKLIKPDQLLGSSSRHTCFQAINKAQTVMAGNVTNHLGRLSGPGLPTVIHRIIAYLRMFDSSHNTKLNAVLPSRHSGKKSSLTFLPNRTAKPVTKLVREDCNSGHIRHILFHSQRISRILRRFSSPSFSVNTNSRVHFIHCLPNLVHRFNIMNSHQIEAKTIDMIFLHPVKHGLYHKLTHHRTFTSRFISTTRTVRQCPVFFLTIKITGYCAFKITLRRIKRMIVNHIQNHPDAGFMQRLYHLLEFFHASGGLIRIC